MQIAFDPTNPVEHALVLKILREVPCPIQHELSCPGVEVPVSKPVAMQPFETEPAPVVQEVPAIVAPPVEDPTPKEPEAATEVAPPPVKAEEPPRQRKRAPSINPERIAPSPQAELVTVEHVRDALGKMANAMVTRGMDAAAAAAAAKALIKDVGQADKLKDVPAHLLPALLKRAQAGADE